jgi:hypothetical protein
VSGTRLRAPSSSVISMLPPLSTGSSYWLIW